MHEWRLGGSFWSNAIHSLHFLPVIFIRINMPTQLSTGAITQMVRSEGQQSNPAFQPVLQLLQVKQVGPDRYRVRTFQGTFILSMHPQTPHLVRCIILTLFMVFFSLFTTVYYFRWTALCSGNVGHSADFFGSQWTAQGRLCGSGGRFHD